MRFLLVFCPVFLLAFPCTGQERLLPDGRGRSGSAAAGAVPQVNEKMVGRSIKLLAKTYVRATDLNRLKNTHINRIRDLTEESFRITYAYTLELISESPRLVNEFGLDPAMDRAEAIRRLQKVDKKTLYRMIDAVPDKVIARRFAAYVSRANDELKEGDLSRTIEVGWQTFQRRLDK